MVLTKQFTDRPAGLTQHHGLVYTYDQGTSFNCSKFRVHTKEDRMRGFNGAYAAIFVASALLIPSLSYSRTWYVKADGSGDTPSISAACDSAAVADTVLIAAGEYEISGLRISNGIVFASESGPAVTRLVPPPLPEYPLYGVVCQSLDLSVEVTGFWLDGFNRSGPSNGAALLIDNCDRVVVHHNIFTNSDRAAIRVNTSEVYAHNNTFVDNVIALDALNMTFYFNIVIGDPGDLFSVATACCDFFDLNNPPIGNFTADPLFCGSTNFYLQQGSPCAPGNSPFGDSCGLIGALPVGCSTTDVRSESWGRVKHLYRNN